MQTAEFVITLIVKGTIHQAMRHIRHAGRGALVLAATYQPDNDQTILQITSADTDVWKGDIEDALRTWLADSQQQPEWHESSMSGDLLWFGDTEPN